MHKAELFKAYALLMVREMLYFERSLALYINDCFSFMTCVIFKIALIAFLRSIFHKVVFVLYRDEPQVECVGNSRRGGWGGCYNRQDTNPPSPPSALSLSGKTNSHVCVG